MSQHDGQRHGLWLHPQRGVLPPADFLPMIEDHPLAIDLGWWVIENTLLQIERWQEGGLSIQISVNIGRRHLMQAAELPGWVRSWTPDPTWGDLMRA